MGRHMYVLVIIYDQNEHARKVSTQQQQLQQQGKLYSTHACNMAGTEDEISDLHQHTPITGEQYVFPNDAYRCLQDDV